MVYDRSAGRIVELKEFDEGERVTRHPARTSTVGSALTARRSIASNTGLRQPIVAKSSSPGSGTAPSWPARPMASAVARPATPPPSTSIFTAPSPDIDYRVQSARHRPREHRPNAYLHIGWAHRPLSAVRRATSAASCARERTPSLAYAWARWTWTVDGARNRRRPISALDSPSARRAATWRSAGVRLLQPAGGRLRFPRPPRQAGAPPPWTRPRHGAPRKAQVRPGRRARNPDRSA